jgi:flavin-dependent dehydrogenase
MLHFDASDRSLRGYAWDFPTLVDGRALVCRGVYRLREDGSREGAGEADVGALLAARLRRQGIDPAQCRNKRYAERGFEPASRVAAGGLMLVGEAAGIDPLTGEGIAQAIEYGVLAGRFLAGRLAQAGPAAVDDWASSLRASRLAFDLRVRTRFLSLYYGASRAVVERAFVESPDALYVGCQHFAAQPHDWLQVGEVVARGGATLLARWISVALGG